MILRAPSHDYSIKNMSPGLSADQKAPMNQLVNAMVETAISLLTGISFSAYGTSKAFVCLGIFQRVQSLITRLLNQQNVSLSDLVRCARLNILSNFMIMAIIRM